MVCYGMLWYTVVCRSKTKNTYNYADVVVAIDVENNLRLKMGDVVVAIDVEHNLRLEMREGMPSIIFLVR